MLDPSFPWARWLREIVAVCVQMMGNWRDLHAALLGRGEDGVGSAADRGHQSGHCHMRRSAALVVVYFVVCVCVYAHLPWGSMRGALHVEGAKRAGPSCLGRAGSTSYAGGRLIPLPANG